ncbi:hypothetical protein bcere0017_39410 [Bacillus cereus Rock1-3]|nr:hypothetical protein bcere0017_39410 [Bacillus cereus Rock1-3]PKR93666.1 WbbF [Bacillus cereus Rock4-18]
MGGRERKNKILTWLGIVVVIGACGGGDLLDIKTCRLSSR